MHEMAQHCDLELIAGEIIDCCYECGNPFFEGPEIWEEKGKLYCEQCINKNEKIEKEDYFYHAV